MVSIPFNKPFIAGKELYYISQAVLGGKLAGNGRFTRSCQRWMEAKFGAEKVLLTHSCTGALEMSAILAGIEPGDEVIMPSYTFVSTAIAFALRGAKIRFVDIRSDTKNLDEKIIEEAITPKTKAVVVVHYAGVGAEMDTISAIARKHGLMVIEDAAQGVDATYKGRYLGTIGHLGTYSFHETKNFISGEGGALVINDPALKERAEIIWEKGTNRSRFFRGEVDKYTWVDIGSSFLPSEITAAFLYGQLEQVEVISRRRHQVHDRYMSGFSHLPESYKVQLPACPPHCRHNAHMFYLVLPSGELRDELIRSLKADGIGSVFHYIPLHSSPMGQRISSQVVDLPITDSISDRLLRLPCYFEIAPAELERVVEHVLSFFEKRM